jgi:magnesium-transporting ATPase (P-type)
MGYLSKDMSFADIFTFAVASLVSGILKACRSFWLLSKLMGPEEWQKKKIAIIRSLPATETLSVTDIIATDKTGTLTQNR